MIGNGDAPIVEKAHLTSESGNEFKAAETINMKDCNEIIFNRQDKKWGDNLIINTKNHPKTYRTWVEGLDPNAQGLKSSIKKSIPAKKSEDPPKNADLPSKS